MSYIDGQTGIKYRDAEALAEALGRERAGLRAALEAALEETRRLRSALKGIDEFVWEDGKDPGRVVDALKRRARSALVSGEQEDKK